MSLYKTCPVCGKPIGPGVQHEHLEVQGVKGKVAVTTVWSSFWKAAAL